MLFLLHLLALFSSILIILIIFINFETLFYLLFKDEISMAKNIYAIIVIIPLQFIFQNYAYLFLHKTKSKNLQ